jgi:hypothetical protein
MPLTGLECPKCGKMCDLAEAPEHMDFCGALMAESVQALVNGEGNERRGKLAGISPSMVPTKSCRREVLIQRNMAYTMNPMKVWAAEQGTTFHSALLKRGRGSAWWLEQNFPAPQHRGRADVRDQDGFLELELWPGVWVSTQVDKMSPDGKVLIDLKTQRPAKVDYGPKNSTSEWAYQLNLERMIIERLGLGPVEEMWVWRLYGYAYEEATAWRKFKIPIMDDAAVEKIYREWAVGLAHEQSKIDSGQPVEGVVGALPMDGKLKPEMKSWKCHGYCAVKSICFGIAGEVVV